MENTLAVNRQGACDEDAFPNINRLLVIAYTLSRSRSDRHALLREIRGRGRRDMPLSLCKGSSKKALSSQSVLLNRRVNKRQTTIVVAHALQVFSQTLKPYNYKRLTEFSFYFFQKWAFIGRLDTLLAKTLLQCTLILQCLKFGKLIPLKSN